MGRLSKLLPQKTDDPVAYICRKKFHALVLQAVVDYNLKFMDIATGFPGSFHDTRVLRLSSIFDRAEASDILSSPVENINGTNVRPLILGDGAYPLKSWLIKRYPHIGALTRSQRNFNWELSKNRAKVEQAFGMLKTRWRYLQNQLVEPVDKVSKTISVCCILHNICVDINDKMYSDSDDDNDNIQAYNNRGKQVRESIRRLLI